MNLLQIHIDSADRKPHCTSPQKAYMSVWSGPDECLAAAGPATSSLSTAIIPICLQFPHSSSEVNSDGFPTPPQLHTAPHCTRTAASLGPSTCTVPITLSTHTCMPIITHTSSNKCPHEAKQADTHEEDVKWRFL